MTDLEAALRALYEPAPAPPGPVEDDPPAPGEDAPAPTETPTLELAWELSPDGTLNVGPAEIESLIYWLEAGARHLRSLALGEHDAVWVGILGGRVRRRESKVVDVGAVASESSA